MAEAGRAPANRIADWADAATRAEVEAKAMQAVMDRERGLGFEPVDVSSEDRGYDIESRNPATGRLRFMEARGRRADARTVSITRNEMLTAFNAADSLTLAVSLVEGEFVHHPLYLPNPAPAFGLEPGFDEVSQVIAADAIKRAAGSG